MCWQTPAASTRHAVTVSLDMRMQTELDISIMAAAALIKLVT